MAKASGNTKVINASSAAAQRTTQNGGVSGKVKNMNEALKVIDTYKNLYNMPQKEQKAFTDSYAQAVMDTVSVYKEAYKKEYEKNVNEAFAKNDKTLYDSATKLYNKKIDALMEDRKYITEKYNNFIKVKK